MIKLAILKETSVLNLLKYNKAILRYNKPDTATTTTTL